MDKLIPRKYSFVKLDEDYIISGWSGNFCIQDEYNNLYSKILIYFGEIPNLEERCILMEIDTGVFHIGEKTEDFIELNKDEITELFNNHKIPSQTWIFKDIVIKRKSY